MPEIDGYFLDERDYQLFKLCKKLVAEAVPALSDPPRPRMQMSPEVYLAALEDGQILAAEDSGIPGKAACKIYRVDRTSLEAEGTLTTRTSDIVGTLTMDETGHDIDDGDLLELLWNGGARSYVVAGEVLGTSVPITKGVGTDLPETGTDIHVSFETFQIAEIEEARKIVFNTTQTEMTGSAELKYFPVARDKFGNWLLVQQGGASVSSYVLQPTVDIPGSTSLSGSWMCAPGTFWKLKQNTEGSDTLEYARDESDEKITVQARNLTTYDIKGSIQDIEASAHLVPQICYGIEDDRGQIWIVKSYPDSKAKWIRFSLPAGGITQLDLDKAGATVIEFWDGYSPGSTVTVRNKAISSNHQFRGNAGAIGLAVFDPTTGVDVYRIVDLECPPEP